MSEKRSASGRRGPAWLWWTLGVLGAGVLVGFLLPIVHPVRETSSPPRCKNNLRLIGIACHLYAEDYDGHFPDNPRQLYPSFVDNIKRFSCPSQPSADKDSVKGVATESGSYRLIPGLHDFDPGTFILAYDASLDNHGGRGRNVLFVDGSVEFWGAAREAEFQQRLAEQAGEVRKWKTVAEDGAGTEGRLQPQGGHP
ncbi:MAG TPA: hypothetical protein PK280_05420 [Planctomycetota bacterium]|nr:hypothetical protein [Planctomycetota bacterium]